MSNLLTNMSGVVNINGTSRQICQVNDHEKKDYELIYEPTELGNNRNYILIHVAYNQDIHHTLFFPIQSLGKQVVPFEVDAENIIYFDVNFYGTMKLKDTYLSSVSTEVDKVSNELKDAIENINGSIGEMEEAIKDGLIEIFYQPTQPNGKLGDLWYDTSVIDGIKSDKCYRHNGTSWELVKDSSVADAIKAANEAQATADGKIVSYYQNTIPTSGSIGDLWIDIGNNNKLYRHNGTTFVDVSDKTIEQIKDIITENKSVWDKIKEITDNLGNVIGGKITGGINLANAQIQNSNGRFIQNDYNLMWVSANNNFASLWNENGIYFSNSKDGNGNWIWQNAIGSNGVIATKVVAEALYGLTVNALNLVATNITSGSIKGVEISGSKFISTSGTRTMTLDGGRIDFRDGNKTGLLSSDELNLFGSNKSVHLEAYNNFSIGEGSMLYSNNTLIVGNSSYSNNIQLRDDGYIDINPNWKSARCTGDFEVWGDKNSVIPTQHYGVRALYAEEADKSYFSTKGIIDMTELEYTVELNPIFLETIEYNSNYPYIIFLTPYSDAHVYVSEVADTYFFIKSDKPTRLAYDLKAIRISYGEVYLEEKTDYTNKQLAKIQEAAVRRIGGIKC